MHSAIVLFNGIKFNPAVVEAACEWAKENERELLLLTLRSPDDKQRGYGYPSDITITENITTDEDAEKTDNLIVQGNMKLAALRCDADNIAYHTTILSDPSSEELKSIAGDSEIIFTATDSFKPASLTVESINLEDWLNDASARIVYIDNNVNG